MKDPKTIEQTVAKALESEKVELVDLVIQNQGKKKLLQFFVDKVGGVTLDDCGALTDKIDAVLEMENLIDGAYILEVSSPGVQRVLKKPAHFKQFISQRVKIVLKVPLDGRGFFTGVIASADEKEFVLDDGTNQYHFAYDNIKKANLDPVLEF
ncbi:MAG: ribosome maturation factor RimP [Elusimicrobiaceae bacterium]|nr:ribosome maturation factor RimP [Elusimicrobiaceae bacterium]